MKLLHIFAAFWLVTGTVGRNLTLEKAKRSQDIHTVRALLPLSDLFEKRMVIPGSTAVLIAGLVTAWSQGWPILGFLQGGSANWVLVSLLLYLSIIPVIRFVFLPAGKRFETALNDAVARDQVTPELNRAFHDPSVQAGHRYEMALFVVIIALMVLKPF